VIKQLNVGDTVLLIRTTGGDGDIPALCMVKAYWKQQMLDLSQALWGSPRFPYIFFFDTEPISLTWTQFKEDVGYAPNFRPSGNVYRVRQDRLERFGGVEGYLDHIRGENGSANYPTSYTSPRVAESTPDDEYSEGKRLTSERSYFRRNPQLVKQAKEHYGYSCQVCGFNFSNKYGVIGSKYIECHHLNPLSERSDAEAIITTTISDVRVVCSNCHRMLHRRRPALTIEELQEAMKEASA
jgi:5-methylcytosine-specific restriction protein A